MANKIAQVTSNNALTNILQKELDALGMGDNNRFVDSQWSFDIGRHRCSLDFSIFESPHLRFRKSIMGEFNDKFIELSISEFAKIIWLGQVKGLIPGSSPYRGAYNGITLLFAFLFEEDSSELNSKLLESYMAFILTRDVTTNGVIEKFSSPSYANRVGTFSLAKMKGTINRYKIENVLQPFGTSAINAALNKACISILGITASEYQKGGSFNFLGLDVGKHYIDHCHNVFEENLIYISSLYDSLNRCLGDNRCNSIYGSPRDSEEALVLILKGERPPAFQFSIKENLEAAIPIVHKHFRDAYKAACQAGCAFTLEVINTISSALGLPDNFDAQEFIRSLIYVHYAGEVIKSQQEIWNEYIATLPIDCIAKDKTLNDFKAIFLSTLKAHTPRLPKDENQLTLYLKRHSTILDKDVFNTKNRRFKGQIKGAVRNLARAGTTCLLAITGWRASEFNFSLNDISTTLNLDVMDNYYTPLRISILSDVPKTGGKTKQNREITLQALILLKQIIHLKQIKSNEEQILDPGHSMANNTQHWWEDFVDNYQLFIELEKDDKNKEKIKDTSTRELLRIREQVKTQLPRVRLGILHRFSANLDKFKNGKLNKQDSEIFNNYLSKETKQKIQEHRFPLSKDDVLSIRSELLSDTLYPTPHAFRHIWAEAVLRRYRGDVGKFIQANFKHMDSRFFIAYLRGKVANTMRKIFELAERSFINSTVLHHLESMNDERREYAGNMDRYLSKAINITNIKTPLELQQLATTISNKRILSSKPNPWCSCMLRVGTERYSKCSINGIPNRQNASPRLCLDCINADISAGNFNGIVVYIKGDIDACQNPNLPMFIKEPHIEMLRIARKRVWELYKNSGKEKYKNFIDFLDKTILDATISS